MVEVSRDERFRNRERGCRPKPHLRQFILVSKCRGVLLGIRQLCLSDFLCEEREFLCNLFFFLHAIVFVSPNRETRYDSGFIVFYRRINSMRVIERTNWGAMVLVIGIAGTLPYEYPSNSIDNCL